MSKKTVTVTPDDGSGINMIGNESYWYEEAEEGSALYLAIERIAELEAERDVSRRDYEVMHKLCIGAETERDQLLEQNEALSAHVGQWRELGESLIERYPLSTWITGSFEQLLTVPPQSSLARIQAAAKAEALDTVCKRVSELPMYGDAARGAMEAIKVIEWVRDEYRKQAEGE